MDKFIHRGNLAPFRRRFDDPGRTDAQRRAILSLLTEEHARGHTTPRRRITKLAVTELILFAAAPRECGLRMFILMRPSSVPLIHIKAPGQLLGYWRLVRGCPNVNMGVK